MAKKDVFSTDVTLTEKDYLHFNMINCTKMVQAFIVYAVVFLFVLTKMGYYGEISDVGALMTYLSRPLIMFLLFLAAYVGFIVFRSKSTYHRYPMIQKLHSYQLNNKQMLVKTENGEAKVKWEDVYQVNESKKMIIVYSTRSHAHLILKSSFKDQDEIIRLKAMLKEVVPKKKFKIKK